MSDPSFYFSGPSMNFPRQIDFERAERLIITAVLYCANCNTLIAEVNERFNHISGAALGFRTRHTFYIFPLNWDRAQQRNRQNNTEALGLVNNRAGLSWHCDQCDDILIDVEYFHDITMPLLANGFAVVEANYVRVEREEEEEEDEEWNGKFIIYKLC